VRGLLTDIIMRYLTFLVAILGACAGCARSAPAETKKAAPATVQSPKTEAELTTVTLAPDAVKRIGIETAPAAIERVAATRMLGGEIVVPEGRGVVVSAPVAGTIVSAGPATPGARVARGEMIFRMVPLAAGERDQRIEADRAVAAAAAEELAARQRVQRLEQLLTDGATSQRAVEEARSQHKIAAAALDAARGRLTVVAKNPIGAQGEITIAAPLSGVLQTVSAAQGQTVAAAAPLFQVAQVDTLWVRVPLYAGDMKDVDRTQPASVTTLDSTSPPRPARPISAPLKGDPTAASVDLYFELSSGSQTLRPGERVMVQIPLAGADSGLVIPDSAIVYDIHGATWAYEDLGGGKYARRRIDVARHVGGRAVVARGLAAGTTVVTVGAAELLGTEFGAGK
jgi:RND family efflux transporter MFP subunit